MHAPREAGATRRRAPRVLIARGGFVADTFDHGTPVSWAASLLLRCPRERRAGAARTQYVDGCLYSGPPCSSNWLTGTRGSRRPDRRCALKSLLDVDPARL